MKVFDLLHNNEKPLNVYEISRETNTDVLLTGEGIQMRALSELI